MNSLYFYLIVVGALFKILIFHLQIAMHKINVLPTTTSSIKAVAADVAEAIIAVPASLFKLGSSASSLIVSPAANNIITYI